MQEGASGCPTCFSVSFNARFAKKTQRIPPFAPSRGPFPAYRGSHPHLQYPSAIATQLQIAGGDGGPVWCSASRYHLPQVLQGTRQNRQSPRDRPSARSARLAPGPPASADRSVPRLLTRSPPPSTHPAVRVRLLTLARLLRTPIRGRPHPDPKSGSDKRQGQSSAGQTPALTGPRKCPPGTPTRAGCVPGQDQRSAVPAPGRGDGSIRRCPIWVHSSCPLPVHRRQPRGRFRDMSTIGRRCTFPTKVRAGADSGEPGPRRQPGPRS